MTAAKQPQSGRKALIAKLHKALKSQYRPVVANTGRSMLEQVLFACCLENSQHDVAEKAFARLLESYFDLNEIRVTTVAELAVAGRPAIQGPLPGAIDDHQTGNARALAEAGGAWTMPQSNFTPETLTAKLTELLNAPNALTAAAIGARTQARPNAAALLADLVEALAIREVRA